MKNKVIEYNKLLNYGPIAKTFELYQFNIVNNCNKGLKPLSRMHTSIHGALIIWFLSRVKRKNNINFLEMGTFCGANIAAISQILPDVKYTTVDLQINDERLSDFYCINKDSGLIIKNNREILGSRQYSNVTFLEMSTTRLFNSIGHKNFDLYWIDADHENFGPFNDLNFGLSTWTEESIIMMDDIILNDTNPSIKAINSLKQDYEFEYLFTQKRNGMNKYICIIYSKNNTIVKELIDNT